MPLEWWSTGKPKPSILALPHEVITLIVENLYLQILETSLATSFARPKFEDWQSRTAFAAFGICEGLRWIQPWHRYESVTSTYMNRTRYDTPVFSLLPQEIVDDIVEYHYMSLLQSSLYTGGAYMKFVDWQNTVPTRAFGPIEGHRWRRSPSCYPALMTAFNEQACNE